MAESDQRGARDKPQKPKRCDGKRFWDKFWGAFKGVTELGLGACLLVVAYWQYTVYSSQAVIMGNQAAISKQSNDIAAAIQRAFMVVDGLQITPITRDGNVYWDIEPIIENTGNTPTRNLAYVGPWSSWSPNPRTVPQYPGVDLPAGPDDPALIYRLANSAGGPAAIVGPHAKLRMIAGRNEIGGSSYERLKKIGVIRGDLYVYGAIRYDDIFPGDPTHITKYCYVIKSDFSDYSSCGVWDCADNECDEDAKYYNQRIADAFKKAGKPVPEMLVVPLGQKMIHP